MNGAAGTTQTQMQQVLGWGETPRADINAAYRDLMTLLPQLDSRNVTVQIANGIWVRRPNVPDTGFVSDARRFFSAPVLSLATPAIMHDSVNAWGARATRNMIPRVLEGTPRDDLMMLLGNTVYFAGTWRERFDPARTAPRAFALESGSAVQVPMMSRASGVRTTLVNGGDRASPIVAAELPYGNSAYAMLLLMPATGSVGDMVQRLDTTLYAQIARAVAGGDTRGEVVLPRFTLATSRELSVPLSAMGMGRAFSNAAEFPRLFPAEPTKIGFVQHAVAVAVEERGTRAAAVTVVGIVPVSMPMGAVFNRPFLFLIRERLSGAILFAGVVRDPRQ
jgi:serpin B